MIHSRRPWPVFRSRPAGDEEHAGSIRLPVVPENGPTIPRRALRTSCDLPVPPSGTLPADTRRQDCARECGRRSGSGADSACSSSNAAILTSSECRIMRKAATERVTPATAVRSRNIGICARRVKPDAVSLSFIVARSYQTSTGPLGTGMDWRATAAGSCMKDATIGACA